jgi:hypothetical protein
MHLPPEARGNQGLRLRLHVLTFRHLQLCRELFQDQFKRNSAHNNAKLRWATLVTLTPAQILTLDLSTLTIKEIGDLIRKVYPCKVVPRISNRGRSKPVKLYQYAKKYGPMWSKLKKEQLCQLLADICQLPDLPNSREQPATQPIPVSSQDTARVKRKSVMNLYLHAIVSHLADFYQVLDFKNCSTERGEAFLASMKHVVLRFTGRDFSEVQTMREVLIRHCWQARVMPKLRVQPARR